jgi:general secretion pathway protein K
MAKPNRVRVGSELANERGVALIVVLWIFIFLFVVAFEFSAAVREEATAAHRYRDETEGYYLALAGFQKGLYEFLNQPTQRAAQPDPKASDLFDGHWREEPLGAGGFRVRLVDEAGKINVNRVDEGTLRRVFVTLGVEEPRINVLVDSIMDWRDPDELHRANGAENDYYRSLTPPYTAKNGPLDSLEELLWIRGVSTELFFGQDADGGKGSDSGRRVGLREVFTVDSPSDRVNLRTAPAEIIHVLMGIPLEKCRSFVEERKKLSEKTMADLLRLLGIGAGDAAVRRFVFTNPTVVAVEAEGRASGSARPRRVKGVVRSGGGQQGFALLRWIDRDMAGPGS